MTADREDELWSEVLRLNPADALTLLALDRVVGGIPTDDESRETNAVDPSAVAAETGLSLGRTEGALRSLAKVDLVHRVYKLGTAPEGKVPPVRVFYAPRTILSPEQVTG